MQSCLGQKGKSMAPLQNSGGKSPTTSPGWAIKGKTMQIHREVDTEARKCSPSDRDVDLGPANVSPTARSLPSPEQTIGEFNISKLPYNKLKNATSQTRNFDFSRTSNFCGLPLLGVNVSPVILLLQQMKLLTPFQSQIQSQVFKNTSQNTVRKG